MRKMIMVLFVALMPFVLSAQSEEGIENQEQMVLIPAGEFMMGSDDDEIDTAFDENKKAGLPPYYDESDFDGEKPKHKVYLDAYYIDKYEVTNAQYKECVVAEKCRKPSDTKWYDNESYASHPVVYVDWNQADNYCKWAGKRLPTEAEWEKAARGDKGYIWPWGNTFDCKKSCNSVSPCEINTATCAAGSFTDDVSPYGVYDMAGNVQEWVSDWLDTNYYENSRENNPQGPENGEFRMLRGGTWIGDVPFSFRGACRGGIVPTYTRKTDGFRCAKSAE